MSKLDYKIVSVFVDPKANDPSESGNLLAVFPAANDFTAEQMQQIAQDLQPPGGYLENFSETVFVSSVDSDRYSVRIFTPREELAFAGHPTLGTAWALRDLGRLPAGKVQQRSAAGVTDVVLEDEVVWFHRAGKVSPDLRDRQPQIEHKIAMALGIDVADVGLEPRELGRSVNRLHAAVSDAGIPHLIVPLKDTAALERCRPVASLLEDLSEASGAYCVTATAAGFVRARGFFPALGIAEDPATGSAAASLGIYLAARIGPIDFEIQQGIEMGRPCRIGVKADADGVHIGGRCQLIFDTTVTSVP